MNQTNNLKLTLPDYDSTKNWSEAINRNFNIIDNLFGQLSVDINKVELNSQTTDMIESTYFMEFTSKAGNGNFDLSRFDNSTTDLQFFACFYEKTRKDNMYVLRPIIINYELSYPIEIKQDEHTGSIWLTGSLDEGQVIICTLIVRGGNVNNDA